MENKDDEIDDYNNKFMMKVLKSALYTFFIVMLSMWGIALIFGQSDTAIILSLCIGIIFTVFYCTFTLIEEIRKKK